MSISNNIDSNNSNSNNFAKKTMATCALGSSVSGFYLGYMDSKGISVSNNLDDVLTYGPTLSSLLFLPTIHYSVNFIAKLIYTSYTDSVSNDKEMWLGNGKIKRFSKMNLEEKMSITNDIMESKQTLERKPDFLVGSIALSSISAISTYAGYGVGKLMGQYF